MHTSVLGGTLHGIDAHIVQVEVDIASGLPGTRTVGLAEAAAREGNERVRAAVQNSGLAFPCRRITINLAPADVRKKGSSLDLAVAAAIVAASERLDVAPLAGLVLYGELGLDGRVRAVPGALAAAMAVRRAGLRGLVVAPDNAAEAAAIEGPEILVARSLAQIVAHLKGEGALPAQAAGAPPKEPAEGAGPAPGAAPAPVVDLAEIRGQAQARRALEVAAAGGHNILLVGPPGSGKTMLARALPAILPPLGLDEAIEVTRIHGALGTGVRSGLIRARPFRSPHHTVSNIALVGGGSQARPGEVSLAHHGVLFLDELPEFQPSVLEVLRQPLEEGVVAVARAARSLVYPAAFMLVGAMNPCRCGHLGDPRRECSCTPHALRRYRARLSGPLLDRIDLHVEVPAVTYEEIAGTSASEPSRAVGERVLAARRRQEERYRASVPAAGADRALPAARTNARAPAAIARARAAPDPAGRRLLAAAMARRALSARAHDRVLRVARTIADLEECDQVAARHIAEALRYRSLDRSFEAGVAAHAGVERP